MTASIYAKPSGTEGALLVGGVEVVTFGSGGIISGLGKNKLINGNFGINQRGYVSGAATTASQYTLDRWKVTGTAGITFSTTNNVTTVTIPSGQTLQQVIEGVNLQSGTHVLSWSGTAQARIDGGAYGASGAVTATATGGTNMTVEFGPGTVSFAQLEQGSLKSAFEQRFYGQELALCQRYYEVTGLLLLTTVTANFQSGFWSVEKRVAPTLVLTPSAGTGGAVGNFTSTGATTKGFFQSNPHSSDANASVSGSAEL